MAMEILTQQDIEIFDSCAPIAELSPLRRLRLQSVTQVDQFDAGALLLEEGTEATTFHILLNGSAEVYTQRDGAFVKLADLGRGDYFGAHALLAENHQRTASIRATSVCRIATIDGSYFLTEIASEPANLDRFDADAAQFIQRPITASLRQLLTEAQDEGHGLKQLSYQDEEIVFTMGDQSDAVYLVLSGTAIATLSINGKSREVARIGVDQLFGELGVLHGEPRAATITALGYLELLRIDSRTFLKWHQEHPSAVGLFNAVARIYDIAQQRGINVILGEHYSRPTMTVSSGKEGSEVITTKIIGEDSIFFQNTNAGAIEGDREEVCYSDSFFTRKLRVIVTSRKEEHIETCVIYAVRATGIETDLATLYQHIRDLTKIDAVSLKRFQRTGFLGGTAHRIDRLCTCLGLGPKELLSLVAERGNSSFDFLQKDIGVGSVCGGCERAVRCFLERTSSIQETREIVADVTMEELSADERQLAALIAQGMGTGDAPVTREQIAVRLKSTGVRDMESFIDRLFPGVFNTATKATPTALAAAVGRGIGFVPWRSIALQPRSFSDRFRKTTALFIYHVGRYSILMLVATIAAFSLVISPAFAGLFWCLILVASATAWITLLDQKSRRFLMSLITGGPARYYRALWRAFGHETSVGILQLGGANKTFFIRDAKAVDEVLQHPDIFARESPWDYPPFGAHSMLGGGSSGVWLGYRFLFEEYFSETFRNDVDLMREVVRERMAQWKECKSVLLLDELYRIVLELRARVFFQGSFGCFSADKSDRFISAVDRILGPEVQMFNSMADGDVQLVRNRVLKALQGSTRSESIGGIILEARRKGIFNEHEALENAMMYTLAQAPAFGLFWTVYRTVRTNTVSRLRDNHIEMVKAIKEELRLHPPVTSLFQRKALKDTRLGDTDVPAGSIINLCPMYIHTSPAQWTSPMEFDASRWEVRSGDSSEIPNPRTNPSDNSSRPDKEKVCPHAQRYIPFSDGVQACQGRWFASEEMLVVLEEILSQFDIELEEDNGLLDLPLQEQVLLHIYNRPAHDVRLRLNYRHRSLE